MIEILFSFLQHFFAVGMQIIFRMQVGWVVVMAPSAGVQLVDEKLCADDEMVNHEGFNSSFLEEFIMDAGDGTEDGKQHDGKFDHNPHTNVGCFYLFAHLRSVNYYRTHQDG